MLMSEPKLLRQIGLFDATMIMVGMVIGSGIFLSTGIIAASIPSAGLILLAWVVGGLLTLAGAFIYAELGAAMPEAGGQFVYIHKAYGELAAFLFGWMFFFAYMTGGIASLALAFAEYLAYFFPVFGTGNVLLGLGTGPLSLSAGELVAVGCIAFFTLVNMVGVRIGTTVQNVLTVVKVGTILTFVGLAFTIGKTQPMDLTAIPPDLGLGQIVTGFAVALVAVSWAFDGWNNITFVAGEITDPHRNLTRTLIFGAVIITVIYLVMNVVYLMSMPVTEIAGAYRVAEVSASALFGGRAAAFISAAVLISVLGAPNGAVSLRRARLLRHGPGRSVFRSRRPGSSPLQNAGLCTGHPGGLVMRSHSERQPRTGGHLHHICRDRVLDRGGRILVHPAKEVPRYAAALQSVGLSVGSRPVHPRLGRDSPEHTGATTRGVPVGAGVDRRGPPGLPAMEKEERCVNTISQDSPRLFSEFFSSARRQRRSPKKREPLPSTTCSTWWRWATS
jgi:APA family basic amino acid/polyamine antiporter